MKLSKFSLDKSFIEELRNVRILLGADHVPHAPTYSIHTGKREKIKLDIHFEGSYSELKEKLDFTINRAIKDKNGECRFMYMPNHQNPLYYDRLDEVEHLKKVHLFYCIHLQEAEEKGQSDKYRATTDTSGKFEIFFPGKEKATSPLGVCHACMEILKEKGLRFGTKYQFDFKSFSKHFAGTVPEFKQKSTLLAPAEYTSSWPLISRRYRERKNWVCEECGVDCSSQKNILETHHINGIPSDNDASNLKALCHTCHKRLHRT